MGIEGTLIGCRVEIQTIVEKSTMDSIENALEPVPDENPQDTHEVTTMELAAQTTFAERAGRTQGRMWWGFVRLERKAHGCLVVQGWALGVAKAALLVIKLVVLGVLFYAAFWLALCFCSWSLRPGLCARPIGMMNRNQNGAPVQMDSGCSMADTRSTSAFF